jgi:hypothetical protein
MANNWPPGHYRIQLEDVFKEEKLEEIRHF